MVHDHANEMDPTAPVTEQASCWWVLLNEGEATAADHRAFAEWIARSPERVEAYLQAARLSLALKSPNLRWPATPVEDLVRAARTESEIAILPSSSGRAEREPPELLRATSRGRNVRVLTRLRVATTALVVMAVIATGSYFYLKPLRLETMVGEQRSVTLTDGTLLTLNTATAVEVRMGKSRRTVSLLAGEALFKVAHDATRPFEVVVGDTTLRAVGTQFDVNRRAGSTTVTVVEGRVAVLTGDDATQANSGQTKNPLEAGDQLTLVPHTARRRVHADVATTIAWTERKLVFAHRPLGEVADEFNRYNRQIIEIQSAELRKQEVTGVFQADDPGSFLAFLSRIPGVTVRPSLDHSRFVVADETQSATP